jgi:hypothetical protein
LSVRQSFFIYKSLLAAIQIKPNNIALEVASTGIAAQLLKGGSSF